MKEEQFDKAIECYSKAIAIDGSNAVYYCNRYYSLFILLTLRFHTTLTKKPVTL